MENILFINSCIREDSRTILLAKRELEKLGGNIKEIVLQNEDLKPLNGELLSLRDELIKNCQWNHSMFNNARDFAYADRIVIAAPFWDLGFPSILKIYLESILIAGITFKYCNGIPHGLCNAKSVRYITTSGGPMYKDFGYSYIKALACDFLGIKDVSCVKAENLDIDYVQPHEFFEKAKITEIV